MAASAYEQFPSGMNLSILPPNYLTYLYGKGLVASVVDKVPDLAFKSAGSVQNDPIKPYDEGLIMHELNRLSMIHHVNTADKWKRLQGGSLIFIGATGSGTTEDELIPERIKNIEYLRCFSLSEIRTTESIFNENINSPNFGKIEWYKVVYRVNTSYRESYLHHSRCIPFFGIPYPDQRYLTLEQAYWGISIVNRAWPAISDYYKVMLQVQQMLKRSTVDTYKVPLMQLLSAGNEAMMRKRMQAIQEAQDLLNAVLIDLEEEHTRDSIPLNGVADIIDRAESGVSAATGYPVSTLFGISPGGLNSTGGAEERQVLDMAYNEQTWITPEIQRLVNLVAAWKGLPEGDYSWKWGSLITLSDQEIAEEDRKDAEAERTRAAGYDLMIKDKVLLPEEVRKLRYSTQLKAIGITTPDVTEEALRIMEQASASNQNTNQNQGDPNASNDPAPNP